MKNVLLYDASDSIDKAPNKPDDFRVIADFWSELQDKHIEYERLRGFQLNEKNEKIPMASTTESIIIKQARLEIDKVFYFAQGYSKERKIQFSTIELNFSKKQLKVVESNEYEHIFTLK
jgi:hypothetical protein